MYPYVALHGPTYRENSHANHTWHRQSHQSACFKGPDPSSVWVRFPSPLHFSLSGVSLCCPRRRLGLLPSSHSLDAATTVPLIECVDRPLGRVRSLWSHPSVIDPLRSVTTGGNRASRFDPL